MLASRLGYALLLGPVFAWYLLARGVDLAVTKATSAYDLKKVVVSY